ncbi:hypothetical protein [Methylomicrobium album]|uniref:hypothetical protein n=1 Tax=Methylomicrobium album TaxID=39775 RepID=UPI0002D8F9F0|nr:hypothetical protein [Methylomicrobium album]
MRFKSAILTLFTGLRIALQAIALSSIPVNRPKTSQRFAGMHWGGSCRFPVLDGVRKIKTIQKNRLASSKNCHLLRLGRQFFHGIAASTAFQNNNI